MPMVKIFRPAFAAVLRRFQRAGVVVLAVGEQHQHLVMVAFLERGQRGVDGRGEGRAALRNRIHVQRLHALLKRRVVNRQRTFQKRVAGERDQAQPVRAGLLHQFQCGESGAREAVRRDVLASMLLDVSTATTMSNPRCSTSCRSNPCCGRASATTSSATARSNATTDFLPRGGDADRQLRQQPCLDELRQQFLPRAHRPPEKHRQRRRQYQQQPE